MKTIKLKDILAISGKSGLFRYVAQARSGIVVESLDDQKRHVAPATARVSSLEEIAIFTEDEEVPLADLFYKIHTHTDGGETLSHKSPPAELEAFFGELIPEYDRERVYASDIRKVFQWYNQLHAHQMLEVIEKEEESEEKPEEEGPGKEAGSARKASEKASEKAAEKAAGKVHGKVTSQGGAKGVSKPATKAK